VNAARLSAGGKRAATGRGLFAAAEDAELGEVVEEGDDDDDEGPGVGWVGFERAEVGEAEFVGEGSGGEEEEAEEGIEGGVEDVLGDGGEEVDKDKSEAGPDGADDGEEAAAHGGLRDATLER
jgi:hypothetical protein